IRSVIGTPRSDRINVSSSSSQSISLPLNRSIRLLKNPIAIALVSCPRNSMHFAGGQLAVFQDANERPYLTHTGRVSNAEKQPTGPGPTGCDENGPAAALLVGHVSIQICSLPPPVRLGPPCRRPILIATKYMLFRGQDTSLLVLGFYSPLTSLQLEDSMSECRTNILPRFVERG